MTDPVEIYKIVTNGVIERSTGDLLRAGFCDFRVDGTFNEGTETYHTDVPFPAKVKDQKYNTEYHNWDGSQWKLI